MKRKKEIQININKIIIKLQINNLNKMNIGQQFQFDFAIDRGGTFTDIYCVITD